MPKLPQPLKQQLSQLVGGTLETVGEQPKEMVNTAAEQIGITSPKVEKKPSQSVLKPGETLSTEAIEQKRKQDLIKGLQIVQKLDQEALQISQQKEQQKTEADKQDELARQQQIQAAQQNSVIAPPEARPKRGSAFGFGRRKKQSSTISSALEKSHAETVGKRVGG